MGKKTIMRMLLTLGFFQVGYTLLVIIVFIIGTLWLSQSGALYPPNKIIETVQTLKEKIESGDITTEMIPDYIEYAKVSKNGEIITATINNEKLIKQVFREGIVVHKQFMNGITYRHISGSAGEWIIGYKSSTTQFSNSLLRKIFPSADFAIVLFLLITIVTGFAVILRVYRNSLRRGFGKIINIRDTILDENHDFSNIKSSVKEINEILTVLGDMEKLVKISMREQLRQARLLEEGIQALTHDIQTPATVVLGNIELLEETQTDKTQQEYLNYAKDGIRRITDYVTELKNLSKMEKIKPEGVAFDARYIRSLVSMAKEIATLKDITIIVTKRETAPDLVVVPQEIRKAYQNIVSNAVEASSNKTAIELSFKRIDDNSYAVSVLDYGRGFSAESLKRATQKFFSENKGRNNEHYGLGLSIVDRIMKDHSGYIQIDNVKTEDGVVGAKVTLIFQLH